MFWLRNKKIIFSYALLSSGGLVILGFIFKKEKISPKNFSRIPYMNFKYLEPDQADILSWPDLGQNCLQFVINIIKCLGISELYGKDQDSLSIYRDPYRFLKACNVKVFDLLVQNFMFTE